MKTIQEQVACAKRELAMRRRVYPNWVASGRMTQDKAEYEIACMDEIITTLAKLAGEDQKELFK